MPFQADEGCVPCPEPGAQPVPLKAALDAITALLAALCDATQAQLRWFDPACGTLQSVYVADGAQWLDDTLFAAQAARAPGLWVVEDALSDARLAADRVAIVGTGLRFWAGLPMTDHAGAALGTLVVASPVPQRLNKLQEQALQALAKQSLAHMHAWRERCRRQSALQPQGPAAAAPGDSASDWRLLFERNPLPMWIFDVKTLEFLAVNEAAVQHYGWSAQEFRAMTIKDIRPPEEVPLLLADLAQGRSSLHGTEIWRHRRRNGEHICVEITAHSVPFEGRAGRLVLAHDVTARVQAAQALAASEQRWQRLFAASATGIAAAGMDGLFTQANPAFCELVGRSEAALLGMPMLAFTHPDDARACQRQLDRLAAGEVDSFSIDKRYLRPGGAAVWARAAVTITPDGADGPAGAGRQFVAVVQDTDAEHRARGELQRQHALAALAGRVARLGGWQVLAGPQQVVHWTPELRAVLDIPAGHEPGVQEAINWYLPGSRERMAAVLQACLDQGTAFDEDMELVTPAGRHLCVRGIGLPLRDATGRIIGAQGALIDQTERHQAQQTLRLSEERFRHVARAIADAVWDWDLVQGTVWRNEGMQTLLGQPLTVMEPGVDAWAQRIHADDVKAVQASLDEVVLGSSERWSAEYRLARADGSHVTVLDRGFAIRDASGRTVRMVGGITDLSAQRATEQRLRRQAALLDAARDAIVLRDLQQRVAYWSRGAERLFGWTADQALGRRVPELLHEDPDLAEQAQAEVLQRGEWAGVMNSRCQDGRTVMVDVRLTLLRDHAGEPEAVLAIKTDVTQRLALQAQLNQSQRLEAVGQLTGGVAHDFNNLLTVILGNSELLLEQLADRPGLQPLAQMTLTAAQRGAELTQRLLAFARKQPLQPQAVDAHQLLSGMDALLRRTLPENVELELVRAAGLWPLLADPVQLESAVLNLVLNARDAMPGGGKVTVETANAWIDEDYAARHPEVLPGQYVLLSVSDTGTGMDALQLARAFEPFFTTKGVGKGTGLGLSMVYGFAKQSNGHAKLYSEPGHGTTARIYLPRANAPAVASAPTATTANPDLRGRATVLVVEDDALVRRFAGDLLSSLGYRVLLAEHGTAALALLRARADIDLLFTDVVMPGGMNGRQLADAALALHPRLKVLFTSGYTENAIVHHGRLDRGVHLLAKPYRSIDLARKVRAMLA